MRLIVTSKGEWVAMAGGPGKCRPIGGVARRGRQGVGLEGSNGVPGSQGTGGGGVQWEQRAMASCGIAVSHGAHWRKRWGLVL